MGNFLTLPLLEPWLQYAKNMPHNCCYALIATLVFLCVCDYCLHSSIPSGKIAGKSSQLYQ